MGGAEPDKKDKKAHKKAFSSNLDDRELALVNDIGKETYDKIYPILLDFGDKILFDENKSILEARLKPLLSLSKIREHHTLFTFIVF